MKKILLIEDNDDIRENTAEILELANYKVVTAPNGKLGIETALAEQPDLIVCDIMMPVLDGYGVLHTLHKNESVKNIPFIFLTAKTERSDLRRGMELGADDYITKPFNPRELTIRARNLLTRVNSAGNEVEEKSSVEYYRFNDWSLEINSRSLVSPQGESYKLPRSEFRAMLHFVENPGKILTRADLLMKMTGRELKPHDRTVDVTIRRIRKHFESLPDTPEIIATIHGEGYRFCGNLED